MIYRQNFLGLPLVRRSNRRVILCGWWLATLGLIAACGVLLRAHPSWGHSILFGCAIAGALFGASLLQGWMWIPRPDPRKITAGIRTVFDPALREAMRANPPADERERAERYKAKSLAYDALMLAALLIALLHYSGALPATPWLREVVLWLALFVVLNLPQAVYLWTEPDIEIEAIDGN